MRPRVLFLLLVVAAVLAVLVPSALADSQVRIVRLSYTDGPVQIDRDTGHFEKAIMNMPIVQGTRLASDDGARAEVEFEDGSTIRLGPRSEVDFAELGLRDNGGKVNMVEVKEGTVYFDIAHRKNDEFRVVFAADEVRLERSARFRVTLTQDRIELAALKGDLKVQGLEEVSVKSGHTLNIDPDDGRFAVAKGVAEDPLDEWVKAREEYRDQYATNASYGAPYSGYYGVGDLNYYGNYFYQAGWGWLWRPYYVGSNWDPFFDGAWCWYPGYGYTWVSTYPWGWIPYRYGSWVYVPGWGWAWQPGGWRNWRTVPVIVNAPAAFRPPQPPVTTVVNNPTAPGPIRTQPTVLVRGRLPVTDEPRGDFIDRDNRPVRIAGPRQPRSTQPAGQPGTTTDNVPVRTRDIDRERPGDRSNQPRTEAGPPRAERPSAPVRTESPARVDRPAAPARVDSPARVERPSAPPARVERPSAPPPRMERPSAPPPRMESPRIESPRTESRPSSPPPSSRPIKH